MYTSGLVMVAQTPELDKTLLIIISKIEEAMAALHAIQTATIQAQGQNPEHQSSQFQEIRQHLKEYWEDIATFLKSCYSFADYVGRLHVASESANQIQLSEFLEDLCFNCEKCKHQAQKLIDKHQASIQCYKQYEAQFSAILHLPSRPRKSKQRKKGFSHNGEESMGKFIGACDGLGKAVRQLPTFFAKELEACKRYSEAVEGHRNGVSLEETGEFAKKWIHSEKLVLMACSAIAAVCDAILIPAEDPFLQGTLSPDSKHRHWSRFQGLWNRFIVWLRVQNSAFMA